MPLVKHTIIYLATIVYTSAQHTVIQILVYVEISHSLFEKLRFNFHIFGNFSFNSPTAHTCRTQCDLIFFFVLFFAAVEQWIALQIRLSVCVFVYPYSMLCDQKWCIGLNRNYCSYCSTTIYWYMRTSFEHVRSIVDYNL